MFAVGTEQQTDHAALMASQLADLRPASTSQRWIVGVSWAVARYRPSGEKARQIGGELAALVQINLTLP